MERTAKKNFLIDIIYITIIGVLVYVTSRFLLSYLLPFVFATLVAYLVQKPSNFLSEKLKVQKGIIALILSLIIYLLFAFILSFAFYRLVVLGIKFTDYLPNVLNKLDFSFERLNTLFSNVFNNIPQEFNAAFNSIIDNMLNKITGSISSFISSFATNVAKSTPAFLISCLVALVATCYIAKDFTGLLKFCKQLMGKKRTENFYKIKTILFESVFKLLKGYLLLSFLTYVELLLGFFILKIKFAPLLALIISLVDLLPVIGTGTIMIPWAVILVFLGNYSIAFGIGILYTIIVILRNFLEPKIISIQIGINPLFTLIAMFIGLKLLGVLGLFLFPIILIVVIRYYKEQMQEGLSV